MHIGNGLTDRFIFFIFGGAVATLATLLLAPRSGRDTRYLIIDKVQEGREALEKGLQKGENKVHHKKEKLASEAMNLLEKAKNISGKEKEIIIAAIQAGRAAFMDEIKNPSFR